MLRKLANNPIYQSVSSVFEIVITVILLVLIVLTGFQRFSDAGSFFGYRIFTVATGSMIPMYDIGDTLLVKDVPIEDIKIGDAVTYSSEIGGRPANITHEVIDIELDENGKYNFHTKGIANNIEDPIVGEEQVVGKVIHKFFFLSILGYITTKKILLLLVITIPLAILVAIEIIKMLYREETEMQEEKRERKKVIKELKKDTNILSEEERKRKIEAIRNGTAYVGDKKDEKHLSNEDIQKKIDAIHNGTHHSVISKDVSEKHLSDILKGKDVETINFDSISDIEEEKKSASADFTEEEKQEIADKIKELQAKPQQEKIDEKKPEETDKEVVEEKEETSEADFQQKIKQLEEEYKEKNEIKSEEDIENFLKYVREKMSEELPSQKEDDNDK